MQLALQMLHQATLSTTSRQPSLRKTAKPSHQPALWLPSQGSSHSIPPQVRHLGSRHMRRFMQIQLRSAAHRTFATE